MDNNEAEILRSWEKNADAWTNAIKKEEIESRKLITNAAIIDSVISYQPKTVLDIGCGEGWLTRALIEKNINVKGVDVIPELIENAKKLGKGEFVLMSYEDIANRKIKETFDAVVCNFSLLGNESVYQLIKTIPSLLNKNGNLFIQTLHPIAAMGELPYQDGWREGSWTGFSSAFTNPAPWYFRTIESWVKMFSENNFYLNELREPLHPKTNKPASIIYVCKILHEK